ncbi:hypothetical protein [Cyclobacterium jeungdonense]|uniref:Uncharacterized protein n=1 Tax=Cyclobacterium jeungdonense TaxID=708087 RepID=A0ABT8C674_9BACT|nr:hypothetical protein [Cyclobacterium jeungdonense]MDN3687524.1 hypothetical protein [Cyclobacterium jeungdonense]
MPTRTLPRKQLRKWNVRSSTLTLVIYILYGVFYRVELPEWYDYSLLGITILNLLLVLGLLGFSLANRHLVDHFKTAAFLGIFRLVINVVLLILIINNGFL